MDNEIPGELDFDVLTEKRTFIEKGLEQLWDGITIDHEDVKLIVNGWRSER